MKEIADIILSYHRAVAGSLRCALATVVHVEGSSYRRPGARMLVTEDGQLTGAISGGCLEGDALRKALLAINQQENKLVSYDSTNEEEAAFGIQLGCNGIVHILFEPIDAGRDDHAIVLLTALQAERSDAVLVTGFSLENELQPGTSLLYRPGKILSASDGELLNIAASVYRDRESVLRTVGPADCQFFFEFIEPAARLVIAGAGNDVQPLVHMASILGWETIIADGRPSHAKAARFPGAARVLVARAEDMLDRLCFDNRTALLLITHNYQYDKKLIASLASKDQPPFYIGLLGPRSKLDRVIADLEEEGVRLERALLDRFHGPIGLDLGAENSPEIALSILAEIQLRLTGAGGQSLSVKKESIHSRSKAITP